MRETMSPLPVRLVAGQPGGDPLSFFHEGDVMTVRCLFLVLVLLVSACAPSTAPSTSAPAQTARTTAPSRPLSILVGKEPASLSLKPLGQAGSTIASSRRLFNATLTLIDASGGLHPYLAE